MRLLLLSDIHANLEALEACLEAAPPYDQVMNLGDIVGYNASPNEVCERVRAMKAPVVRGNHDRACSGLLGLSGFNVAAAISAHWTQTVLEPEHAEWLRALPAGPLRCAELEGVEFVHGSPRDEDEYLLNGSTAGVDFQLPGHSDLIFFGHT
ncbi:MAG TPA: metallophosphoesterase, partial [Terriglobales bacterium]|nr:metallophosphoesterase [Terriglobales bacterium]